MGGRSGGVCGVLLGMQLCGGGVAEIVEVFGAGGEV